MMRLLFVSCLSTLLLCACESLNTSHKTTSPPPVASLPRLTPSDGYLDTIAALSSHDLAHQSDVLFEAERAFTQAPTTANQLRYALALAVPGHPGSDPVKAKKLLEQLNATPQTLTAQEQALVSVMLNVADEWLKLQTENRRLAATVDAKSRTQSNADRRYQTQADEIARLRKALDAAQQKLDAIKDLEKSISERSTSPAGSREPGSRDNPTQTQTSPAGR